MTRALQQTIHVACRQLGLDAEARREMQMAVTGKASMREMDQADLELVVDHLKGAGFAMSPKPRKRAPAPRADLRLIHVLWKKLEEAGEIRRPGREGLNAFVRTRFEQTWGSVPADIDMLRDHRQIDQVIQALKDWGRRAGIDFDFGAHTR